MSEVAPAELGPLLDKLAIRDVLERYMRYNDDLAADRIAELFDEDARFQVMGKVHVGREAIRAMFNRDGANRPPWTAAGELFTQPASIHISSNPVIDIDGDTASAESDFLVVRRDPGGRARSVLVGRYRDRLRRLDDGRWVIYTRTGVSVARPGDEHTDHEWATALSLMSDSDRAQLRT
ncbi:MAG TPA: nuclear transport factor 2 family protein [Acidimicrobiales bacterium]|nr:nuclear transport factor 2 family protein [Acidimicrobiales bacterium]